MTDETNPTKNGLAPKARSAFVKTFMRKSGEAFDLAGKALLGVSLLKQFAAGEPFPEDAFGIVAALTGFLFVIAGIYLQAEAER